MTSSTYGVTRAINELHSIFSCQWTNGMLPQIRFVPNQLGYRPNADDWSVPPSASGPTRYRTSGITQPPIVGLCTYELFRKLIPQDQQTHRPDFLAFSAALENYHQWLLNERDPWRENLLLCLHPWETGTDNSPAFDPLIESTRDYIQSSNLRVDTFGRADTTHVSGDHRPTDRDYFSYFGLLALFKKHSYNQREIISDSPFLLQDILFNSIFVTSLYSLARLQDALAQSGPSSPSHNLTDLAQQNRNKASAVSGAIRRKLWDPTNGSFYSHDSRSNRLLPTETVSGLMPLLSDIANPQQASILLDRLLDPNRFWTEGPLPSTAASSPAFNPVRYWSGPTWPVTNWLILLALRQHDPQAAEDLRQRTLRMIAEGINHDHARHSAIVVLRQNSFGEEFTTPSTRQYQHGWLWDSAIVAATWPLIETEPQLHHASSPSPGFWEYYHPHTGAPLGAPQMTWTASLFLEMLNMYPH